MKSYPFGNAFLEQTNKAARLKMFESIDKSLSELLKKTANQTKVWFLSYVDSKKRIFPRLRAYGVAPATTVYTVIFFMLLSYFLIDSYILEWLRRHWHCCEWVHPGLYPKVDCFTFPLAIWLGMLLRAYHTAGLAWLCSTLPALI